MCAWFSKVTLESPGLAPVHHVLTRLFGGNYLRAELLHGRVAAAVVAVMVRIYDVFDGLAGQLLHFRDDVVGVLRELVVYQQHAFIGDQSCGVSRHQIVMNYVQVIGQLNDVQFRGLGRLSVGDPESSRE